MPGLRPLLPAYGGQNATFEDQVVGVGAGSVGERFQERLVGYVLVEERGDVADLLPLAGALGAGRQVSFEGDRASVSDS